MFANMNEFGNGFGIAPTMTMHRLQHQHLFSNGSNNSSNSTNTRDTSSIHNSPNGSISYSGFGSSPKSTPNSNSNNASRKLCFNFLRGTCRLSCAECEYRHPSGFEVEKEKQKLGKIECRYGDECIAENCLYKHINRKFVFSTASASKPVEPQVQGRARVSSAGSAESLQSTKKPKSNSGSNLCAINDIASELGVSPLDETVLALSSMLRSVSGAGFGSRTRIPQAVMDSIARRPANLGGAENGEEDAWVLFTLLNVNKSLPNVYDLSFQNPKALEELVAKVMRVARIARQGEVWLVVSSGGDENRALQNALINSQMDYVVGLSEDGSVSGYMVACGGTAL